MTPELGGRGKEGRDADWSEDGVERRTPYSPEQWMEKQETAYTAWLNHLLAPGMGQERARPDATPHALASRRMVARVRGVLETICRADVGVINSMMRLEGHISRGRFRMLPHGGLLHDVRLRKRAVKMLMAYDPFWLKLGLQIVVRWASSADYGAQDNSACGAASIACQNLPEFIKCQFLVDHRLEALKTANKLIDDEYEAYCGASILKRFLLLVALLDRAVTRATLPFQVPLLFDVNAKIKSSAQMVTQFLAGSMHGSGDVIRQLELMGYCLQYIQISRNEYNYRIDSLAVDLRDGIRLCKLAQALTGCKDLLSKASFRAERQIVKVQNIELALRALSRGNKQILRMAGDQLQPQDLVDGHREKSLQFLWNIALHVQLPRLINTRALQLEIFRVRLQGEPGNRPPMPHNCVAGLMPKSEILYLLMKWVQAVVEPHGVQVKNFTSSFADGSVLCLLVNHYLPNYLLKDDIYIPRGAARIRPAPLAPRPDDNGADAPRHPSGPKDRRRLVARNFELASEAVCALGGTPEAPAADDFAHHGAEEKAIVLFVAFLCARLLETSKEDRAALVIQRAWRGRILPTVNAGFHLRRFEAAVGIVQRSVRSWLVRLRENDGRRAFIVRMQAMRRGLVQRRRYLRMRAAARTIQARARAWRERRRYREVLGATRRLQAARRGAIQRRSYLRVKKAALKVQATRRASVQRRRYLRVRQAATTIQAGARTWRARKEYHRILHTTSRLQATRRGAIQRRNFLHVKKATLKVQATRRGSVERRRYLRARKAATTIQAGTRAWRAQKEYRRKRQATRRLQANRRGAIQRRHYLRVKKSVLKLQAGARGWHVRRDHKRALLAATRLQALRRGGVQRRNFLHVKRAVVRIQSFARMRRAQLRYKRITWAAKHMQAAWHGRVQRHIFANTKRAAIAIQSCCRMWRARKHYQRLLKAVVCIQAGFRSFSWRKRYIKTRAAIVRIQRCARLWMISKAQQRDNAAICIQRIFRGWRARKALECQHRAAVCVQRFVRGHLARMDLPAVIARAEERKAQAAAARRIQAHWRGILVRKWTKPILEAARQRRREQWASGVILKAVHRRRAIRRAARLAAARRTLSRWAPAFLDRCRLLRARRAATTIQRAWRRSLRRRHDAAVAIQAGVRRWLAVKKHKSDVASIIKLQALWRGRMARMRAGAKFGRVRRRLRERAAEARLRPERRIGARCRAALEQLCRSRTVEAAAAAVSTIAICTQYSVGCCQMVVEGGGVGALVQFIARCHKNKHHMTALQHSLDSLSNICSRASLVANVFTKDALATLTDRLQTFREHQDVFLSIVSLLRLLCYDRGRAAMVMGEMRQLVKQWEAVAGVLARTIATERKAMGRVEDDKYSDNTVKGLTHRMFAMTAQLRALNDLLEMVPDTTNTAVEPTRPPLLTPRKNLPAPNKILHKVEKWCPKNTMARIALSELQVTAAARRENASSPTPKRLKRYHPPAR